MTEELIDQGRRVHAGFSTYRWQLSGRPVAEGRRIIERVQRGDLNVVYEKLQALLAEHLADALLRASDASRQSSRELGRPAGSFRT